jgi:hypothetical protein
MNQTNNSKSNMQKVALTSLAGTSIEWYDFFLYGASAALIFPTVFFGETTPSTALILSLLNLCSWIYCKTYWWNNIWSLWR